MPSVENVSIEIKTIVDRDDDPNPGEGRDFLLWSDDFERLRPYLDIRRPDMCIVYSGDSTAVLEEYYEDTDLPEALYFWPGCMRII